MPFWRFWRRHRELDLDDELSHDFAATVEEEVRAGSPRDEAERTAQREFGSMILIKERVRDTWRWGGTNRFWEDVRYGLRSMRRTPGPTTVILLTMMLGISANAVVFSVIDAVLIKPLPYRDPGRIVFISGHPMRFAYFDFIDGAEWQDWTRRSQSFESIAGYLPQRNTCTVGSEAFDVGVAYVAGDLLGLLGLSPTLGRNFLAEEVQPVPGRAPPQLAMISEAIFRERFAGNPEGLGKVIVTIGKVPYIVIGVLPRDPRLALPGLDRPLLAIDVVVNRDVIQTTGPIEVLGRLRAGSALDAARSEITTLHASYSQQHPERPKSVLRIMPLQDRVVGETHLALLILWASAGFVLLVACANVTNLLLARSAARAKEIATRAALGASRGRLVRQLLTESVVLTLAGGVAGIPLAMWGIRLVATQTFVDIPRLREAALNWNVLLFCVGLCTIAGILAGLAPAVSTSYTNVGGLRGDGSASLRSVRSHRLQGVFVVSELAVAVALLTGAGLMLKSLWIIRAQTSVFAPEHVLETGINARSVTTADAYLDDLTRQIEALPSVQAAAAFTQAGRPLKIAGLPVPVGEQAAMLTIVRVTPHYKTAAGLRLVSGRWLSDDDLRGAPRVAVVNESVVRILLALYPTSGPIVGRQIDLGGKASDNPIVVGVVSSLQRRPDADPEPQMFVPSSWWPLNGTAVYLVRTTGDPMALAAPIQKIVSRTPGVEMRGTQTGEDELLAGLARRRMQTNLIVTFAGLALLLGMAGVYGVLSYGVSERTNEIGVRLAIGAQRSDVLVLVLGRAAKLVIFGIAAGLSASAGLSRLLISLLYGVVPTDPWTYGIVSVALFSTAIVAAYLPARRATRVDPVVALRYQ